MSSLTSLLVTSHSRCRIGRGRTPCVGCAQGMWREAPARRKSWPEGPAGSDLGKGHFPHRSYKRKQGQVWSLENCRRQFAYIENFQAAGTTGPALLAKHHRWLQSLPFCLEEAEFYQTSLITQVYCQSIVTQNLDQRAKFMTSQQRDQL